MKKYCLVKNGNVEQVGGLPTNFNNVSNFYLLPEDEIKKHGWLPVETISDNKEIQENVEYIIEENLVKEIITTRDKTQEEIDKEKASQFEGEWHSVRIKRNNLLTDSDIEIVADKWENMDASVKLAWSTYRQELRNIPQTFSIPSEVIWPNKP